VVIVIGAEYAVDVAVGIVMSVVYLIVAAGVPVASVATNGAPREPPVDVIVGVATTDGG
jgi:hypothetical protein